MLPRVLVVGLHGHGRWHVANVARLAGRGGVELAGVCDPRPPTPELQRYVGAAPWEPDLDTALARARPDVTVLCTPIHTHADLAARAAAAGSHVLLEKPPVPSLAAFDRLTAELQHRGTVCQVGFQNLGSGAIAGIRGLVADGTIGELRGIGFAGVAVRDGGYFSRGDWAGRRRLDGIDVVDGVLTNPFVHAVAAAMRIAGAEDPGAVAAIELELHRANPIESDDTSVARIVTSFGVPIVVAATLCAEQPAPPALIVHGTRGRATWEYQHDVVHVDAGGSRPELRFERTDLLENLLGHLADPTVDLIVPLASTRAVTEFVDAVRRAPEPAAIGPEHRRSEMGEGRQRWIVDGAAAAVHRSAETFAVFTEQQVAWAVPAGGTRHVELAVDGRAVATYELTPHLEPELAPRPFLHPVATLGGVVTTDCCPTDHRWHLGAGVAIQDVGGVNCWGGRTYRRDDGYQWRDDHGSVRHVEWIARSATVLDHRLAWFGPDHHARLVERRTITARQVGTARDRWLLGVRFALTNVTGQRLELSSPGAHGRTDGGYGGFFWRLRQSAGPTEVRTDRAAGEQAVHGSVAPWLAWVDRGDGTDGPADGAFTLLFASADARTAADPWFVRQADYPGVGSALAWDQPLVLEAAATEVRTLDVLVVDGAGHDAMELYEQLVGARTPMPSEPEVADAH